MSLTNEEMERFDKVFNEILLPVISENKEEIDYIINNNPELKEKIEREYQKIMDKRNNR